MRIFIVIFFVFAVLLPAFPAICDETGRNKAFIEAVDAYQSGAFGDAISGFSALVKDEGIQNPRLYYNLGNSFYKNNELGPAIYWYEKARQLTPGAPDLNYNLSHARSRTRDAVSSEPAGMADYLFFWKDAVGRRNMEVWTLAINAVFWGWIILGRLFRSAWVRGATFGSGIAALLMILTVGYTHVSDIWMKTGIVLPADLAVKAGTTEASTVLFTLHAGTRVRIEKQRSDACLIRVDQEKMGWVPEGSLGLL